MEVRSFTVGPFLENTYVLSDPERKVAFVIDPGGENEKILKYLKEKELSLIQILSTHGHVDHIAGAFELREKTGVPYRLNLKDKFLLDELPTIGSYFGLAPIKTPIVDSNIDEGEELSLGQYKVKVMATPGHTPGGLSFLVKGHVFVGDTLFQGSIGRTDLPGGNYEELIQSIQTKLLTLDGETIVHCGHGLSTTIQKEKMSNPFLIKGHSRFL